MAVKKVKETFVPMKLWNKALPDCVKRGGWINGGYKTGSFEKL